MSVRQTLSVSTSVETFLFNFSSTSVELVLNQRVAGRVRAATVRALFAAAVAAFSAGAGAAEVDDYCDNAVVAGLNWQAAIDDIFTAAMQ
jgi:hypothetical protein